MRRLVNGTGAALMVLLLLAWRTAGAVDYVLPDLDGEPQALEQYRGRWLVVNYWATWCPTCIREIPELVDLHENGAAGNIAVVGINFETVETGRLRRFVATHGIRYPVLRSEPVRVTALGNVPALPTTYIIAPDGRVVAGETGLVSRQQIEDYIAGQQADNEP